MIPKMIVHPSDCHVEPTVQLPTPPRLSNDDVNSRRDNGNQTLSTSNVDTAGIKEPAQPESPLPEIVGQADGSVNLEYHPLASLFPEVSEETLEELTGGIRLNGYNPNDPIIIYEDKILDGRARYIACERAITKPMTVRFEEIDFKGSPLQFVISKNLHRRHLTESQRAMIGAKLVNTTHGGNRKNQETNLSLEQTPQISMAKAAEMTKVSQGSIKNARQVLNQAPSKVISEIERGEKSVHAAVQECKASKPVPLPEESTADGAAPVSTSNDALHHFVELAIEIRRLLGISRKVLTHAANNALESIRTPEDHRDYSEALSTLTKDFVNFDRLIEKYKKDVQSNSPYISHFKKALGTVPLILEASNALTQPEDEPPQPIR